MTGSPSLKQLQTHYLKDKEKQPPGCQIFSILVLSVTLFDTVPEKQTVILDQTVPASWGHSDGQNKIQISYLCSLISTDKSDLTAWILSSCQNVSLEFKLHDTTFRSSLVIVPDDDGLPKMMFAFHIERLISVDKSNREVAQAREESAAPLAMWRTSPRNSHHNHQQQCLGDYLAQHCRFCNGNANFRQHQEPGQHHPPRHTAIATGTTTEALEHNYVSSYNSTQCTTCNTVTTDSGWGDETLQVSQRLIDVHKQYGETVYRDTGDVSALQQTLQLTRQMLAVRARRGGGGGVGLPRGVARRGNERGTPRQRVRRRVAREK